MIVLSAFSSLLYKRRRTCMLAVIGVLVFLNDGKDKYCVFKKL